MPKIPVSQTKMSRIVIACLVIAALAVAVIIAVVMFAARTQAPAGNVQTMFSGKFVCLPHKKTDGPQTLECASGLKTNDGRYYALQFDPPFPGDIEMNKQVEITGILTIKTDAIYDIAGSIKVQSYHY